MLPDKKDQNKRKTLISAVVAGIPLFTASVLAAGHLTGGVREITTRAASMLVG